MHSGANNTENDKWKMDFHYQWIYLLNPLDEHIFERVFSYHTPNEMTYGPDGENVERQHLEPRVRIPVPIMDAPLCLYAWFVIRVYIRLANGSLDHFLSFVNDGFKFP